MTKNIFIRVDASIEIGSGHVMRCLTLADQLREQGCKVTFICGDLKGNMNPLIRQQGFSLVELEAELKHTSDEWMIDAQKTIKLLSASNETIDWLIIDHYSIDKRWEAMVRTKAQRIMVIDDLADREHDCELLLDFNYTDNFERRYDRLTPSYCRKLLGPNFFLLRPEFSQVKRQLRPLHNAASRVMVFFGGSDPTNETKKVLEAVIEHDISGLTFDVIVGNSNPDKEKIRELCLQISNSNYYCQTNEMAAIMSQADFAIGAGGTTTWERCYLGLPTLVILVAENQYGSITELAKQGSVINLGISEKVSKYDIFHAIAQTTENSSIIKEASKKCLKLMGDDYCETQEQIINLLLES